MKTMKTGDLVRFTDVFGNDVRIGLVLIADADYAKTTFGWVRVEQLEVINDNN